MKTMLCRTVQDFFRIINDPQYDVADFQLVNDTTVALMYTYKKNHIPSLNSISVPLATFTTAHARLVLYSYMEQLGDRLIYTDTDSIVFRSYRNRPDLDPPLGDYLGGLTDEIDGDRYIVKFASTGPKSYSYILSDGSEMCKVKGFSLNYEASKIINFKTMQSILLESDAQIQGHPDQLDTFYTVKKNKITRDKYSNTIYNRCEIKSFKAVYTKRVVLDNLDTLPYGF